MKSNFAAPRGFEKLRLGQFASEFVENILTQFGDRLTTTAIESRNQNILTQFGDRLTTAVTESRGVSSNGRALALHARGSRIDAGTLQMCLDACVENSLGA